MAASVLTENQQAFLQEVGQTPALREQFYLTGGTALAEFYLHHRYSEDLDFFSEREVDTLAIETWLADVKTRLGITKVDSQQSYNRQLYFLHTADWVLKTEFTYFPFPRIEVGRPVDNVMLDSLVDIATNKLFTIYQQPRARDYIDLYCIMHEQPLTMRELMDKARAKFDWHIDPLQLATQFVKATEAKDYPRMLLQLEPKQWQDFFLAEAKKLKSDILTD